MQIDHPTEVDAQGIATAHVRSWQPAYAAILPPAFLAELSIEQRSERWRGILARQDSNTRVMRDEAGQVLGFVSHGPCRDEGSPPTRGEIWALYALPSAWGQGVGRALLQRALSELLAQGRDSVSLWVLSGNQRGIRFYRAAGFAEVPGSAKLLELGGRMVEEVQMLRPLFGEA
ncbi:GNAT family N-acetyltransferase [Ideonella azotifigens]|uniref:GNAT family N-acetyltransferase n=1 Tax=Ideonella azotifigens TaxID=513160 RepID=A0ABN1K1A0_9BURK|nr:GNAT family N-acetyltransferase [Ideonella azotifigens]MCD2341665.1 GNAT family N-acetyltransferase [Ideonella azotifigens]